MLRTEQALAPADAAVGRVLDLLTATTAERRHQVHGEADVSTMPHIREHAVELIDGGHRHFILDLRDVTFMDSTGLGAVRFE